MPLQATSGAASYDGFGGGVAAVPQYIEDVFSTYLYNGNGTSQTIANGIDLSTKGGLVWIKGRNNVESHSLWDTARGVSAGLQSNATDAQYASANSLTAYNSNGFSLGTDSSVGWVNRSGDTYASWTFRKQPKFFDVVTYTGTGVARTVAHNLGSVPGCIIVKSTSSATNWSVYHRSIPAADFIRLNLTDAAVNNPDIWNSTTPSSTTFTVGSSSNTNGAGESYVAYIFAHDAGGFGLTGTDNVISCGSYTTNAAAVGSVTLGYEPQWVLVKVASSTGGWYLIDNMRGFFAPGGIAGQYLLANSSDVESQISLKINATGFTDPGIFAVNATIIYIAIRRGPMKVPTTGTSVFSPNYFPTGTSSPIVTNFPVDLQMYAYPPGTASINTVFVDRLRAVSTTTTTDGPRLITSGSAAESAAASSLNWSNTGFSKSPSFGTSDAQLYLNFKRAPGFFDEVCYTGPGTVMTVNHNLQVVPELMIVKPRSASGDWIVYSSTLGATAGLYLDLPNSRYFNSGNWNDTSPTSSVFTVGANSDTNFGNRTYVAYLFATCAGVSKVGSYSGSTGNTVVVPCGFTGGVRFVLIKRTDSTGDWYVWDSARGIIAGNDPYLLLNSTAGEVTGTDYVDSYSAGFEVTSTAPAALNATGGTYIFLAIA